MARPGQSSRSQLRVGRYLGALALLLALLYAGVVFAGPGSKPLTPKLGLDLQGGAQVILTPQTLGGKKATAAQLSTAVEIIRARVNGAGVSEAEVVTEGDQIVVSVPGGNRSDIANVTKTAQLRFREVLDSPMPVLPANAAPAPTGSTAPVPTGSGAPKTTSSGAPRATTSGVPKASKPGAVVVPPSPSASVRKRPVSSALLAPRTAATATPSPKPVATAVATPKPSATPKPVATPPATPLAAPSATPLAAVPGGPLVRSGDAYTPQALAALDCSNRQARQGGGADDPDKEIVACDRQGTFKFHLAVAKVRGNDVKGATVGTGSDGISTVVNINFTGGGQDRWTNLTKATVGKQVGIVLDGVVVSFPTIQQEITGPAQISGQFSQKDALDLANVLKYGALPLTFQAGDTQVISPSLGSDQLRSGLLAGGLGLVAVVFYSLLYYRALGLVTIASLLTSAALTYAAVCLLGKEIGFALSLAGIAGFIVAVGITADSFVVYFERLKDEIKEGRTPRSAVDRGWVRARRTILSADTVSFLAAVILYFVSVGGVRGFAFTLGLSTLLDIIVVFLFTRPLISLLARYRWFSRSRLTGFHGADGGEPSTGGPKRGLTPAPLMNVEA